MTEVTRGFCWHQNFVPWGCLPLTCGYIHLLNHEKMCITSEVEEFFLNLQQMIILMRPSCWHQNFELSAPAQGLCLDFFSSTTAAFNISSAFRWAIQDQWSSGFKLALGCSTSDLVVSARKWFRSVDKYGRRQPSLINIFIAFSSDLLELYCQDSTILFILNKNYSNHTTNMAITR